MKALEIKDRTRRSVKVRKSRLPNNTRVRMEAVREKQLAALNLRKAGATYAEIADALGYNDGSAAKKACDAILKKQEYDAGREVVLLDLQRLDEFQMRCMNALRTLGDLSQIDRLLKIMEKRYMLLGIGDDTINELREAYGVQTKIQNNGVMVIQTGINSEQDFVKKMMLASGINPESEEAQHYLERLDSPENGRQESTLLGGRTVDSRPTPQLTTGKRKVRVVRRRRGEGGATTTKQAHPVVRLPGMDHKILEEEEIIDAEIVD